MYDRDDMRQTVVIARNEVRKFLNSKRFAIYAAIMLLSMILITALPYVVGDGITGDKPIEVFYLYGNMAAMMAVLAATLFSSYAIVAEFEERTALILFTRPVRKISIFVGKMIACIAIEAIVLIAYFLLGLGVTYLKTHEQVPAFIPSLALALLYMLACSGIAMLVSSFAKKGGTAAVVTFIALMLIIPIVTSAMSTANIDTWFMLDTAGDAILTSMEEYVDMINGVMNDIESGTGADLSIIKLKLADPMKEALVLIVWGIGATIASWFAFKRREF